jgi:thioredoxin 1
MEDDLIGIIIRLCPIVIAGILFSSVIQALEVVPYSSEAFMARQNTGRASALHFHTSWCTSCRVQETILVQLAAEKGGDDMVVFVVDADKEKALKHTMGVRMQSTILVFKGDTEQVRSVGDTSREAINKVLDGGGK